MMPTKKIAERFVFEELDAARHSDFNFIQEFVSESGYSRSEYVGAMNDNNWQNDSSEIEVPQQQFIAFKLQISDPILRAKFSIAVVDEVMRVWELGRHGGNMR